jgi:hypothetical protein
MTFRLPWSSLRWPILFGVALLTTANSARVVAGWASEPVAATPISAAIRPAGEASGADISAYLALTKFRVFETVEPVRDDAALKFLVYFLMSTRVIPHTCARFGIDGGEAARAFADLHDDDYAAASAALAPAGLNATRLWHLLRSDIERLAENQFARLADALDLDERAVCEWMAADPAAYAQARSYRVRYPALHKSFVPG